MKFYFNYFCGSPGESRLIVTSRCHACMLSFPEKGFDLLFGVRVVLVWWRLGVLFGGEWFCRGKNVGENFWVWIFFRNFTE